VSDDPSFKIPPAPGNTTGKQGQAGQNSPVEFIEERKSAITLYWGLLREQYPQQFDRELAISLTGPIDMNSGWQKITLGKLKEKCGYFIEGRGFDAWRR